MIVCVFPMLAMLLCHFGINWLRYHAHCRNLPFGGRATRDSWVCLPSEKNAGVSTNVYLRKMLEKPKAGLRILRTKVRELFMHGEGISTPYVCHKGWHPLIKCVKSWLQSLFYFPLFMFLSFWGRQERGSCSYVSSSTMSNSNLRSS